MTFTETAGAVYRTEYAYDDGDRIVQTVYPSGRVIDLQRDGVRRIERIDSRRDSNAAPQTLLDQLRYRGDNRMTQGTYGNGLIDQRQYDLQGRLTHQLLKNSLNAVIDERTYQYDPNSNLLNRDTTPQNRRYRYDALDRLIHESNDGLPVNDYDYDLNDNRLRKEGENLVETYRYLENSNRLASTDTLDSGQKTQETKPPREIIYNDAGRLYQLLEDGQRKGEYLYNDEGQRTRKTVYGADANGIATATTTIYHYDQSGQLIGETDELGNPIKDYLHANGRPVAQIDRNGTTETIHYLTTDHLDTPRLATDQNQAVTWRWEGEAFGETPAQSFGATVNLRFPGQYFDAESHLHYNHFRYYDPETGRYITSDPIGLDGGINTYSYALNNPLFWIDSSGLLPICQTIILGTRRNTFTERERTLIDRDRTFVFLNGGGGFSPTPDRQNPRRPTITPGFNIEVWSAEIRLFLVKEYLITELFQRLKAFCEETRTGECGKTETFRTNFEFEEFISRDRTLLRGFTEREEELLGLLFILPL